MKVANVGIKKEEGYLYFVDQRGDISCVKDKGNSPKKVAKVGIRFEDGYYYFVDSKGDISCETTKKVKAMPDLYQELEKLAKKGCAMLPITEFDEKKKKEQLKEQMKEEERAKLKEKRLRQEIRKELIREEFSDLKIDNRSSIPEEIRHEIWRRDQGQCVKCGSKENLEFDHIIPISKGGSNTVRNIELLCENCNREKSDNI